MDWWKTGFSYCWEEKKKKARKVLGSIDWNLPSCLWEERPLPGHGIDHRQQGSP